MFKFIHAADIHLDSPLYGLERYEGAPVEEIRVATRQALENLVTLAIEESVAFVLIAGDLYDGDWKDYNTGLFLAKQMSQLREVGIKVFIISGNHDAASQITKGLTMPENVVQFPTRKPGTEIMDDIGIAIHGQGFSKRAVTDDLSLSYPDALPDLFNIGLLHTCATGREGHDPYAPCTVEGLLSKNYDYWALGHVHKREVLHEEPWVIYPGNIQGRHVRESGAKGCSLVTVEENVMVEHRALDVLRWDICEVDASETEQPEDVLERVRKQVKDKFDNCEGRPLALRVNIYGICDAHEGLLLNPDKWKNEIRALATDLSGGQIWIEKIKISTKTKVDLEELMNASDPYRKVICRIEEFESEEELSEGEASNNELREEFDEQLASLRKKLPSEAFLEEAMSELKDPTKFDEIIDKSKQLIATRLWSRREEDEDSES